ncbi:MAG: TolC family protein [Epsilonproteobacteria bacterium]|nr:TolC family protein [Campylobacterota bacterium]
MRALIALLIAMSAFGAPKYLSLDDLIALALKQSPDLALYRADLNASLVKWQESRSAQKPAVTLQGGAGGVMNRIDDTLSTALVTGTLGASQLLYDFGRSDSLIEATQKQSEAAEADLKQAVLDKIFRVKSAYYRLLQAKHLIAVAEEDVRLNEKQLYRAQRYFEAGIRTKIDVTDAEVNLLQAQKRLGDTRYDYLRAGYELAREIGVDAEAKGYEILTPRLDANATLSSRPAQSLKELEAYAYAHRPDLLACRLRRQSALAAVKEAKGAYYPRLALEGDYTLNHVNDDAFKAAFPDRQARGLVTLRWNLYEGGARDARYRQALAQSQKSAAACLRQKLTVRQQVADAYTLTQKAYERVRLATKVAAAAKEKFHQAQKRYENGLADFIELQQARQGHIDAEAALVIDIYAFFTALANLDRAVGR